MGKSEGADAEERMDQYDHEHGYDNDESVGQKKQRPTLETIYYSPSHGRSYYRVLCGCGELFDFYCWSSVKKCPKCGFLYGHGDKVEAKPETIHAYLSMRVVKSERVPVEVTGRCSVCRNKIVYVGGFGWRHDVETNHDAVLDVELYRGL